MEAIQDKEELELAERLLPLLRTDRNTKWIRDLPSRAAAIGGLAWRDAGDLCDVSAAA
jgi:hypothetical protein